MGFFLLSSAPQVDGKRGAIASALGRRGQHQRFHLGHRLPEADEQGVVAVPLEQLGAAATGSTLW